MNLKGDMVSSGLPSYCTLSGNRNWDKNAHASEAEHNKDSSTSSSEGYFESCTEVFGSCSDMHVVPTGFQALPDSTVEKTVKKLALKKGSLDN